MSDNFYNASFPAESHGKNRAAYDYSYEDFEKVLDCLFLTAEISIQFAVSLRQPVNLLIGRNDTELILALNYNKAIFRSTILRFAEKEPATKESLEYTSSHTLGMMVESFVEIPIVSLNNVFKNLLKIFNENEDLTVRAKVLYNYYLGKSESNYKDLKKCVDAVVESTKNMVKAAGSGAMLVEPVFKTRDIKVKPDECFYILPFNHNRLEIFDGVVKPNLKKDCNIKVIKSGDKFNADSDMNEDIWIKINEAAFIIADISDKNPNVFYELGICHTLGKKIILICDIESHEKDYENKLPFDIYNRQTIFYDSKYAGPTKLVDEIEKYIKEINIIEQNIE